MALMQQIGEDQHVPQKVRDEATTHQLGHLLRVYKPRVSNPLTIIGIALIIIIPDAYFLFVKFEQDLLLGESWLITLRILLLLFALTGLIFGLARCNLRAYQFTNGIIRSKGDKISVLLWPQIKAYWWSISSYGIAVNVKRYVYTVLYQDESRVIFDEAALSGMQTLGEALQHEVTRVHLPPARAAFDAGVVIPFGPFSLSNQGVHTQKGVVLPWDQVGSVIIRRGKLIVQQKEAAQAIASAPLAQVPNPSVFVELVRHAIARIA